MNALLSPPLDALARPPPMEFDSGDEPPSTRHRTIWISDIHLGTPGCQAEFLLDFLKWNDSDTLYLVGDIIDGWRLRKGWYWPQSHNDVVQKLLRKARKGTRVIYVPGNHDEFARAYVDHAFGGIEVLHEAVHRTADGKLLLVTHGDLFDGVVQRARWLARAGRPAVHGDPGAQPLVQPRARAHGLPLLVAVAVPQAQGQERGQLHHRVREWRWPGEARQRGVDGVVCGHIHKAEIRTIDGILYCNDGDWVESLTALVEDHAGQLRLVEWKQIRPQAPAIAAPAAAAVQP